MEQNAGVLEGKLNAIEVQLASKDHERDELRMSFDMELRRGKEKIESLAVRSLWMWVYA
jgi:hypothetical protein